MENAGMQPVMPINAMLGDGFGYGGGAWFMWIIVLFFLIGGNGAWGNNRGDVARIQDVYAANDSQSLRQGVNNLGNGIANATFSLNNSVLNGFNATQRDIMQGDFMIDKSIMTSTNNLGAALAENRFAQQQCCCETNRNIDAVRYDAQINAGNIQNAIHAEAEETRKLIVANQMQDLRDRLAERDRDLQTANFALSQQVQNQQIIGAVRPFPMPAYSVGNPYGANSCNCGCGVYNA